MHLLWPKNDGKIIKFQGSPEGLYYYKPSEKYKQDLHDPEQRTEQSCLNSEQE